MRSRSDIGIRKERVQEAPLESKPLLPDKEGDESADTKESQEVHQVSPLRGDQRHGEEEPGRYPEDHP